jgi:hypothetical protein
VFRAGFGQSISHVDVIRRIGYYPWSRYGRYNQQDNQYQTDYRKLATEKYPYHPAKLALVRRDFKQCRRFDCIAYIILHFRTP